MTLVQPTAQWKPCSGAFTSSPPRSGDTYARVLEQFHVADHARYAPTLRQTWCNIYAWDVTTAMGCEVPHWIDAGGAPCAPGEGKETVANQLIDLLNAGAWGWYEAPFPIEAATRGQPVIAGWKNPRGPGHVAMVRPHCVNGRIVVAQAGRTCGDRLSLQTAFGSRPVTFWTHP